MLHDGIIARPGRPTRDRRVGSVGSTEVIDRPHTRAYRDGVVVAEGFPVSEVSEHLAQPDTVVWVDLCGPTIDELHELADELGLHELAVEDAFSDHERPKLDRYPTHSFLSCHLVDVDLAAQKLIESEVDAFIGTRWFITVRKDQRLAIGDLASRFDRSPDLAAHGVSYLLYALLDLVVDDYFDAIETFDQFYDDVSEGIFSDHPLDPASQAKWFRMRRALVRFHRLAVPLREAVSSLMRRENGAVPAEMYPYYQDVYDHILRISESTDALRDLGSSIVESNLSLRDYRQNQIMKKVTSWAAIIAVPTLITGFYGMNVPYPGFARHSGVIWSIGLIVGLSSTLFVLFKRNDWL
jgi:magnesium transporter